MQQAGSSAAFRREQAAPTCGCCRAGPPPAVMGAGLWHLSGFLPRTFAARAFKRPWPSGLAGAPSPRLLAGIPIAAAGLSARTAKTSTQTQATTATDEERPKCRPP